MRARGLAYKGMNRDEARSGKIRTRRGLFQTGNISEELQQVWPYSLRTAGKECLWLSLRNSLCQTLGWDPRCNMAKWLPRESKQYQRPKRFVLLPPIGCFPFFVIVTF